MPARIQWWHRYVGPCTQGLPKCSCFFRFSWESAEVCPDSIGHVRKISGSIPGFLDNRSVRGKFSLGLRCLSSLFVGLGLLVLVGCVGASSSSPQAAGSGAGQLAVSPATMNFRNVAVGKNKALGGNLTAGSSDITVSSAAWTGSGYSVSGITFPTTVPAGKSVPFTVTFTPQAAGTASGNVTFYSDAENSPGVEALSGVGTQASQQSVALSWDASTSQVAGYNVYRGTVSGGPYTKINSGLDASTNYADASVQPGQTYYYVTTAVDSQGTESSYSNQAQAVIPSD